MITEPIPVEIVEQSQVYTASEIGYVFNDQGYDLSFGQMDKGKLTKCIQDGTYNRVGFVLMTDERSGAPKSHIGTFYSYQALSKCVRALAHHFVPQPGVTMQQIASTDTYAYLNPFRVDKPKGPTAPAYIQSQGITLIGGGRLYANGRDEGTSLTLRNTFNTPEIPDEHMTIIRRLVREELGVQGTWRE